MRKLYLLRHADAAKDDGSGDINRILTDKGISEVKNLGDSLKDIDFDCDLVLCSSAERTKQTWQTLSTHCNYRFEVQYVDALYNPSIENFIKEAQQLNDDISSVLMISHNPTTSEFANYLTGFPGLISFSTANLGSFNLDIESWKKLGEHSATMEWLLPKR